MRVPALSVLVALALLAASCGTQGSDAGEPATTDEPAVEERMDAGEPAAADAPAQDPAEADAEGGTVVAVEPADAEPAAEVELAGFGFQPEAVEIAVGDTVRWTNGDATRHTVTAGADAKPTGAFHLTLDDRGAGAALEFTEPGEYRYFCTPHPFMQGTVTVSG